MYSTIVYMDDGGKDGLKTSTTLDTTVRNGWVSIRDVDGSENHYNFSHIMAIEVKLLETK